MDTEVSRRKFAAGIESLRTDAAGLVAARGWDITETQYPTLAVSFRHAGTARGIEFRFHFDDWDEAPPSLTLHDPADGREFAWGEWPKGGWSVLNTHANTGKPFLCLPGIREYHTHNAHLNDPWSRYKDIDTYRMPGLVERVSQRFQDTDG